MDGRQQAEMTLPELMKGFPVEWDSQLFGKRRG
jgi:hypothetical protein